MAHFNIAPLFPTPVYEEVFEGNVLNVIQQEIKTGLETTMFNEPGSHKFSEQLGHNICQGEFDGDWLKEKACISFITALNGAVERYCQDGYIVPRLMHFVYFGEKPMSFFFFLTFLSVLRFFKPCLIVFHGDSLPHGLYWEYVVSIAPHIIHAKMPLVKVLNGTAVSHVEHSADFMRVKALQCMVFFS